MQNMKILVTGGRGQLGQAIRGKAAQHSYAFYLYDRDQLDVSRTEQWQQVIDQVKPDVILNAAAYTAVDQAEIHPDEAMLLNCDAAARGAERAAALGIPYITFSTDYVFNGKKTTAYTEDDLPDPLSVYGKSKLAGETKVQAVNPQAIVVRTSWLYSQFGKNFMNTMLYRFAANEPVSVVTDQVASPTCAVLFADHLIDFIRLSKEGGVPGGVYHYSQAGEASWYDLAVAIRDAVGSKSEVRPTTTTAYSSAVKRPAYSKLANQKFERVVGYVIPHWAEGLSACIH